MTRRDTPWKWGAEEEAVFLRLKNMLYQENVLAHFDPRQEFPIQKEALAIVFALHKFYQFLCGRKFILVTDHKPLTSLFGPTKSTPTLAANQLARWALMLNQY